MVAVIPWSRLLGVIAPHSPRAEQGLPPHAHPPHQGRHMLAADLDAFPIEQVAQHPAAGKRTREAQLVHPAHQREIRVRRRPRPLVHRRARRIQQLRLHEGLELHRKNSN